MESSKRAILEKYERVAGERLPRVREFFEGRRRFLVWTQTPSEVWSDCRTPEQSFERNMASIDHALDVEMDYVPYLEPWHGVGVYACSFGCEYEWWEGEAPYTRCAFQHISEALEFEPLTPEENEVMRLVMDTIRHFKRQVGSTIPIVLTDTQSAYDTATLVVDPSNFMVECMTAPEAGHRLLCRINDAIIEFSRMQADAVGDALAEPGHIMVSAPGVGGISVSDDNQSFSSADFNRTFSNPYNDALGAEFGGVAIHSCGDWAHAMPALLEMEHFTMLDCACDSPGDPNPNDPAAVADALRGSGKIAQMRCAGCREAIDRIVDCVGTGLRVVLKFGWPGSDATAEELYHYATDRLTEACA
ncbi:MAG: uroporphyrinogen decarboxylase family protein [Candidatus Brocadiia bacterium]